jgi:hypothetical protein
LVKDLLCYTLYKEIEIFLPAQKRGEIISNGYVEYLNRGRLETEVLYGGTRNKS